MVFLKLDSDGINGRRGLLFVLLGAACWGTLPVFARWAYAAGSDPLTAAAMRAYLSAAVFLVWFLLRGRFKTVKLRELPFYFGYGVFAVGGTYLFNMTAVRELSTSMAVMMLYTAPAFVILFSKLFFHEPITKMKLLALLCTVAGCLLVVKAYRFSELSGNLRGILFGLLSGISYSMTTVLGRKAGSMHDGLTNAGLILIAGACLFLFVRPPWTIPTPSLPLFADYAGLALFGSVLAYIFYLKGLETGLDGGVASITATAEPVIATLLGVTLLGDTLEWPQAAGIAIVVLGIALPHLADIRKKR